MPKIEEVRNVAEDLERTTIFLNFFLRGDDLGLTTKNNDTEKKVQENGNGKSLILGDVGIFGRIEREDESLGLSQHSLLSRAGWIVRLMH